MKKIYPQIITFLLSVTALPLFAQTAKTYTPLEGSFFSQALNLPENSNNLPEYINQVFKVTIGIAAVLAVGQLIHAGIKYMTTESWGEKSDAKKIMTDAFWGILLVVSAWLILNEINPQLVSLNLFTSSQ